VVTGHGIDLKHFPLTELPAGRPRLLSVGRMTPAKDPLTILAALERLLRAGHDLELELVGAGLAPGDGDYAQQVRHKIHAAGLSERVHLCGALPYLEVPAAYQRAHLVINSSHTGSVDKVVLEAYASGRAVLSCNESIPPLLKSLGPRAAELQFPPGDAERLAERIAQQLLRPLPERRALAQELRAIVAQDHEVEALMRRLVERMQQRPSKVAP
jgi:glycosyltransferase involved in cell wall biosynthesis